MTKGVDYTYPLPPARLHARYDQVFSAFKRGQSCTLVGLPLSSRSAYFKFILSENTFLNEFIDTNNYHFIMLEGKNLGVSQILEIIQIKLAEQGLIPKIHNYGGDPISNTMQLQSQLTKIKAGKKIIIILYEASELLKNPEINDVLTRLWNLNRTPPNSLVHFCFIDSEQIFKHDFNQLKIAIMETRVEFPLFTEAEIEYTRKRLEYFLGKTIESNVHQKAAQLSGGHYLIYKNLVTLPEDEWTSNTIRLVVSKIIDEYPSVTNKEIPIINLFPRHWEKSKQGDILPQMTAQQRQIFDLMYSRTSEIISRDDVAQALWGKSWQTKYSDWAIDKSISHLKKSLKDTGFSILTLRNRGYKFINN